MERTAQNMARKKDEASIEETFAVLEEILEKMEGDDCSLEESFRQYQTGMKLVKSCHDKIDKVEKQMIVLNGEEEEE
ncbi:exodeoxyribonuclease VII small subunit [Lachnoclostridium edouardi]|uniref:exodeoxyribonuclease VII small subunit n=1 Tax=Lachnoclostridium edouardi TaxID=1926283 RepID=UPI002E8DE24C|nr:exodeoxyribonuclease VII small subunit [Lachnoclostridium edouardi]